MSLADLVTATEDLLDGEHQGLAAADALDTARRSLRGAEAAAAGPDPTQRP